MVAAHERSLLCYLASLAGFAGRSTFAQTCLGQTQPSDGRGVWRGDDAEIGARTMLAISLGREDEAGELLRSTVTQRGLDSVESKQLLCKWPALSYVLLPETREWWMARSEALAATLGRRHTLSMHGAKAVLRVRAGERLDATDARLNLPLLRTVLPVRWGIEVAVGLAVAGGLHAASAIVSLYGPPARDWLDPICAGPDGEASKAATTLAAGVLVAPSHNLSLSVFGSLDLRIGGESVLPQDGRSAELLAFLATRLTTTRAAAGAALWPDLSRQDQDRLLALTLEHLHRWLEPERRFSAAPWFVRVNGERLMLAEGTEIEVDVRRFNKLLDGAAESFASHAPSKALEQLEAALTLCHADPLPEYASATWTIEIVDALRKRIAVSATRAGELLVARGNDHRAVELSKVALNQVPTLQSAWRLRIDALQRNGAGSAARDAAALCQQTLRQSRLELEPATVEVIRAVREPGRAQPAQGRMAYGWGSLTRTEDDVVNLLLGGRTNRQIGVQLGISPRTVETHLAHVYDKLGIRTRVELAAEAARRAAPIYSGNGVAPSAER